MPETNEPTSTDLGTDTLTGAGSDAESSADATDPGTASSSPTAPGTTCRHPPLRANLVQARTHASGPSLLPTQLAGPRPGPLPPRVHSAVARPPLPTRVGLLAGMRSTERTTLLPRFPLSRRQGRDLLLRMLLYLHQPLAHASKREFVTQKNILMEQFVMLICVKQENHNILLRL